MIGGIIYIIIGSIFIGLFLYMLLQNGAIAKYGNFKNMIRKIYRDRTKYIRNINTGNTVYYRLPWEPTSFGKGVVRNKSLVPIKGFKSKDDLVEEEFEIDMGENGIKSFKNKENLFVSLEQLNEYISNSLEYAIDQISKYVEAKKLDMPLDRIWVIRNSTSYGYSVLVTIGIVKITQTPFEVKYKMKCVDPFSNPDNSFEYYITLVVDDKKTRLESSNGGDHAFPVYDIEHKKFFKEYLNKILTDNVFR